MKLANFYKKAFVKLSTEVKSQKKGMSKKKGGKIKKMFNEWKIKKIKNLLNLSNLSDGLESL